MTISERLRNRLKKRPMITISMRMPEDVIEDLKFVASKLDFSGYQPLIRAYVGQALRRDLAALSAGTVADAATTSAGGAAHEAALKLPIIISEDETGMFVADCPAIPGCATQGATEAEALSSMREAIVVCLQVRSERGMPLTNRIEQIEVDIAA